MLVGKAKQEEDPARSASVSAGLVALGMLASPGAWRESRDVQELDARLRALEAVLTPENRDELGTLLAHLSIAHPAARRSGSSASTSRS